MVETNMAFVSNARNTLEGSVPQIDTNKEISSESSKMDHFEDFFQELEEEDSTPTPQKKQQCSSYPLMISLNGRVYICQNCGMKEIHERLENDPTEEPKDRKGRSGNSAGVNREKMDSAGDTANNRLSRRKSKEPQSEGKSW